jgi:hypothetical protein
VLNISANMCRCRLCCHGSWNGSWLRLTLGGSPHNSDT